MKFIAIVLCLLFSTAAFAQQATKEQSLPPVVEDVLEAAFGILEGSGALTQISDSANCIFDAQTTISALQQALGDFKQLTPDSIAAGIQVFTTAVSADIEDCGNSIEETLNLTRAIFGDLKNVQWDEQAVYGLVNNYQEVFQDVASAYGDFKNGSWLNLGLNVGDIVGLFLFGSSSAVKVSGNVIITPIATVPMNITMLADIMSGLLNGLQLQNNVTELPICESALANFTALIKESNALFNNGSVKAIEQAIVLVGNSLASLGQAEYSCQSTWTEIKSYTSSFVHDFTNQTADIQGLEKMLFNLPQTVIDGVSVISNFHAGDWYAFGQAVGTLINYVEGNVVVDAEQVIA